MPKAINSRTIWLATSVKLKCDINCVLRIKKLLICQLNDNVNRLKHRLQVPMPKSLLCIKLAERQYREDETRA